MEVDTEHGPQPTVTASRSGPLERWIVAVLVVAVLLIDRKIGLNDQLSNDLWTMTIAGFGGLWLAHSAGLAPLYLPLQAKRKRSQTYLLAGAALAVIAGNTYINLSYVSAGHPLPPAIAELLSTPLSAFLMCVRAGTNEETIYRLFIASASLRLLQSLGLGQRAALISAAVVSSVLFVWGVHPGNLVAFIISAVMAAIFLNEGLLPAALVHFLADAIPFTLIAASHLGG